LLGRSIVFVRIVVIVLWTGERQSINPAQLTWH
jgi:hypothetical protein